MIFKLGPEARVTPFLRPRGEPFLRQGGEPFLRQGGEPFLRQGGEPFLQPREVLQSPGSQAATGRDDTACAGSDVAPPEAWRNPADRDYDPLQSDNALAPARGMVVGLLAGAVMWVGIFVLAWVWFG